MTPSTLPPFAALLLAPLLLAGAALPPAAAQDSQRSVTTTTTTTTTRTLGGMTVEETVTEETSVLGEPAPAGTAGGAAPGGAATGGAAAGAPLSGAPAATDEIRTRDGLRYACTGVAKDSREDPRWRDFSAKLVFTVKGGGYLPDVMTRIEDAQGREVFVERCDGPWLLIDLPAGRYRIVATAEDPQGRVHEHTARLSVEARGQSEAILRFEEIPG